MVRHACEAFALGAQKMEPRRSAFLVDVDQRPCQWPTRRTGIAAMDERVPVPEDMYRIAQSSQSTMISGFGRPPSRASGLARPIGRRVRRQSGPTEE